MLGETIKLKLPSISVIVPFVVPCSLMVAPTIGSPFVSTTFPVTLLDLSEDWLSVAGVTIILLPCTI